MRSRKTVQKTRKQLTNRRREMVAINEGTGDRLVSKVVNDNYRDNFDSIFGNKNKDVDCTSIKCPHWDSGWCYKHPSFDTNSLDGQCLGAEGCTAYTKLIKVQ